MNRKCLRSIHCTKQSFFIISSPWCSLLHPVTRTRSPDLHHSLLVDSRKLQILTWCSSSVGRTPACKEGEYWNYGTLTGNPDRVGTLGGTTFDTLRPFQFPALLSHLHSTSSQALDHTLLPLTCSVHLLLELFEGWWLASELSQDLPKHSAPAIEYRRGRPLVRW